MNLGFIETIAVLTVGVVIGLIISLVILFRKKKVPVPVPVDKLEAWNHLEELAKKKAELLAAKKALMDAYKDGKIDDKGYVEESAKLDTKLENVEKEMEETMFMIARGLVPDFMLDARKEVVELEKAIKLSQEYNKLKKELEKVRSERDSLHMQINELEEEKKDLKAKYNWLEENSNKRISELQEQVKDLKAKLDRLTRENQFLKDEIGEATKPESEKLKNLRNENALLREELENLKTRLKVLEKELAILQAIVERYSDKIREGETKTVEELKALIKPSDPDVKDIIRAYGSPEKAYEYVRDRVMEIKPPMNISFWMDVSDVIRIGAGDNDDRAILLCSMLRGLGEYAKVLIVETSKGEHRALVLLEKDGKYYLLDLDKTRNFDDFVGSSEEEVISKYSTRHGSIAKILYEISDKKVVVRD